MRLTCVALAVLLVCSCSGRDYGGHPPYATSGKVLVNGQPVKGARVVLSHDGDWGGRAIAPQAWTGDDGSFVLSTYDPNDGAPAGDYRVSITWPTTRKEGGIDRLGQRYFLAETSGLTVRIDKGKNVLKPFELQGDPAAIKAIEDYAANPAQLKNHHNKGR